MVFLDFDCRDHANGRRKGNVWEAVRLLRPIVYRTGVLQRIVGRWPHLDQQRANVAPAPHCDGASIQPRQLKSVLQRDGQAHVRRSNTAARIHPLHACWRCCACWLCGCTRCDGANHIQVGVPVCARHRRDAVRPGPRSVMVTHPSDIVVQDAVPHSM